jgi:hypothetical protein
MTIRSTLAVGAAGAALALTGAAQAMTPALLDPAQIAGAWTLARAGGASCTITLKAEPAGGNNYEVALGDCAGVAGIKAVASWRVSSDGIGLASADGSTVIFLSRQSDRLFRTSGKSSLDVGGTWTLTRE